MYTQITPKTNSERKKLIIVRKNARKNTEKTKPTGPSPLIRMLMYERANNCVQSWYTIQQKTVLIIFPVILQTSITAKVSSGVKDQKYGLDVCLA